MNRRTQAEFWLERLNQAWEAVIPLGKLETYEDQETLRVEGCRFFHLLLEGNIDMVSLSGTGKEWTLFQAGPLCLINDIPAITGIDNHVRYICCGQVRTVRFESRLLRDPSFFRSYPDLARNLLTTVLHKMEFFLSYAIEQQESSGLERLCRLLVQLTGGRQGCFSIGMGQKECGLHIGMHPASFSRLVTGLRRQGILGAFTRHRLEILDADRLLQIAGGMSGTGLAPGKKKRQKRKVLSCRKVCQ